jgi:hypothetical protein
VSEVWFCQGAKTTGNEVTTSLAAVGAALEAALERAST